MLELCVTGKGGCEDETKPDDEKGGCDVGGDCDGTGVVAA